MATDARAIRTHQATHPDWAMFGEWARETFTRERMAAVGVVAVTLVAVGFLGSLLFTGIQTYSMSGF